MAAVNPISAHRLIRSAICDKSSTIKLSLSLPPSTRLSSTRGVPYVWILADVFRVDEMPCQFQKHSATRQPHQHPNHIDRASREIVVFPLRQHSCVALVNQGRPMNHDRHIEHVAQIIWKRVHFRYVLVGEAFPHRSIVVQRIASHAHNQPCVQEQKVGLRRIVVEQHHKRIDDSYELSTGQAHDGQHPNATSTRSHRHIKEHHRGKYHAPRVSIAPNENDANESVRQWHFLRNERL